VTWNIAKKIIFFALLINPALLCADLDPAAARLEPLPIARRLSAQNELLPPDEFIDAALVFSGITDADFTAYRGKINTLVAEVKKSFAGRDINRNLADDLLGFLHRTVLKRYIADETEMSRLLDTGNFNCVSSSVLYLFAADALGLPVEGVRTKDHAFVRVFFGSASFDVETTSRFGFDPGHKKEFIDEFGNTTGFVYTSPANYADRKDIGRREMLSLILNNRVARLVAERRFDEATGVGADLFELMKNEETLKIVIGIFSSLARFTTETSQFQPGYDILNRAVSQYRDFSQVQDLRRFFVRDWANALIGKKDFTGASVLAKREYAQGKIPSDDYRAIMIFLFQSQAEAIATDPAHGPGEALAVIAEAKKELGDVASLLAAEKVFAHNHILALIEQGGFPEAEAALDAYRASQKLTEADFIGLLVYETQKKAEAVSRQDGFREALTVIETGLTKTGRAVALLKSAGVYAYNWAVKLIQTEAFTEAEAFTAGEKAKSYLSDETRRDLALYLVTGRTDAARKKKDYPLAIAIIEEGITTLGRKPELLHSYEVLVHNRMVEFYDAKDYDQAEAVLVRGLAVYPGSAQLKDDLEKIRKLKIKK
jgi:tetratricopeptide (TPR) repeat protein